MITSRGPNGEKIVHRGKPRGSGVLFITAIKPQKLLKQGCEGYLYNVVKDETPKTSLNGISVV